MHISKFVFPVLLALSLFCTGGRAIAAEDKATDLTIDEEHIVKRLKEEIMRELTNEGFLQQQIDIGIQNYIRKQKEAQVEAQRQQRSRADTLAKNIRPVSAGRDHILGNPNAPVTLVEYSDFECPYCKKFHPTAKRLVEAFDGKLNWVYRHFPLSFHNPGAQKQAEASECASELGGDDAFWSYTDKIYERTRSNGKGFPIADLIPLAVELGMDQKQFSDCLESGRYTQRVKEDFDEGTSIGISGTPGNIFVNNQTGKILARPGSQPFPALKAAVDQLLTIE
jgi:protein-disulfide isomerase